MKKKLLVLCLAVLMSLSAVVVYAQNNDNNTERQYSITVKCRACTYSYPWSGPASSASEARELALGVASGLHTLHRSRLYCSN